MDKLNNIDLKTAYGLVIMTGTERLLEYPERREPLQTDFNDQSGTDYYLNTVFFKDKEVLLTCAIMADNDTDFWTYYNAFFAALTASGSHQLYVHDHTQNYTVFYKKTANFKKSLKRLKNVPKVFVKFDLTLQVLIV